MSRARRRGDAVTTDVVRRNQGRTLFFSAYWGSTPSEVHERPPVAGSNLAILEFAPRPPRAGWRHVTNGMSERTVEKNGVFGVELTVRTRGRCPWVLDLLDALARYPVQHDTFFFPFNTLDVQQPVDQKGSPYTALIFAPPLEENPDEKIGLGAFALEDREVLVHEVVGLYESECDFAIENGAEKLWERLRALGQATLALDDLRARLV